MDLLEEYSQTSCSILDSALYYAEQLIGFKSVTPDEAGSIDWLGEQLETMGADIEIFEANGVTNLLACFDMGHGPSVAFCGHIDVVPAVNLDKWVFPPFQLTNSKGRLYGRGIADMKGGIACAMAATRSILLGNEELCGKLWFLITSDEEGEAEFGSRLIVDKLIENNLSLDYCIIGEPTAINCTGDMLKIGRRGALSFDLKLFGKSGHVAYPEQGKNAIHLASEVIESLNHLKWDIGTALCPGTSLQFTHINSGKWSDNVIPDYIFISFNIRYSSEYTKSQLTELISNSVEEVTDNYELRSYRNCEPYFSTSCNEKNESVVDLVESTIKEMLGFRTKLSTTGGTSDGRFFIEVCPQVIEVGLPSKTIHQENENVKISDMEILAILYEKLFKDILSK